MSLKCKHCGKAMRLRNANRDTALDRAMGTDSKLRVCSCGFKLATVEIPADELSELRRKAYLYHLSEVKA